MRRRQRPSATPTPSLCGPWLLRGLPLPRARRPQADHGAGSPAVPAASPAPSRPGPEGSTPGPCTQGPSSHRARWESAVSPQGKGPGWAAPDGTTGLTITCRAAETQLGKKAASSPARLLRKSTRGLARRHKPQPGRAGRHTRHLTRPRSRTPAHATPEAGADDPGSRKPAEALPAGGAGDPGSRPWRPGPPQPSVSAGVRGAVPPAEAFTGTRGSERVPAWKGCAWPFPRPAVRTPQWHRPCALRPVSSQLTAPAGG